MKSHSVTRAGIISRARNGRFTFHPPAQFHRPKSNSWIDPKTFSAALALHMKRHGDDYASLYAALSKPGDRTKASTIRFWLHGVGRPRFGRSYEFLARIERRYCLPRGYFKSKVRPPITSPRQLLIQKAVGGEAARALNWHLPRDFDARPKSERKEILEWIKDNVLAGATEYGKFYQEHCTRGYALRFSTLRQKRTRSNRKRHPLTEAPGALTAEMESYINFKISPLTERGFGRGTLWTKPTARTKLTNLGLMFGAMAAASDGTDQGLGIALPKLSFAYLVFPSILDWYLTWRANRRGFYTRTELEQVLEILSLVRPKTGWLCQSPRLAKRLSPVAGLVSAKDIAQVTKNWSRACESAAGHARQRAKDLRRIARKHRDTFEAILPILEAGDPLVQYRKIADEILRKMPNKVAQPRAAAEAIRDYLMLRLGMHLGVRPSNLRELHFCPKGGKHRSERELHRMRCGELRWQADRGMWEVFIPLAAFKNPGSSFFSNRPFRLALPNLAGLYPVLNDYIRHHRPVLLCGFPDPGTLFVRTMKAGRKPGAYRDAAFYGAWKWAIQRYGVFNPYTGSGVIPGLKPHGPNSVRDVLATHILKATGSFELASYALQNTPAVVARYYARFLPYDKSALAAKILNQVWQSGGRNKVPLFIEGRSPKLLPPRKHFLSKRS